MKVGLYIGSIKPNTGGAFTYVDGFLKAVERLGRSSRHEFVVFHEGDDGAAPGGGPLPRVRMQAEKAAVLSGEEKAFQAFPGIVGRTWQRARHRRPALDWDARIFRRHGVEFVMRLVPWNAMTLDVPFGAVVWDLQHRNNPWFPEVSERGEWAGREQNFTGICQRASLLFTGTEQGRAEIREYYRVPAERIHVLPFPTPDFALRGATATLEPTVIAKFGLPADFVLYPAQFWPHKNHVALIEACRLARAQGQWDLGVAFVGSAKGNENHVRSEARRLGLEGCVHFLDFVEIDELVQLYRHAFCLGFPTFCGPDNFPPLEAFALGCPVVASDVPGAREQLGEAARLFDPADERELADALLELKSSPALRQKLVAAGRVRAGRDTWDSYVAGFIRALDGFAGIRRAWGP